VRAAKDLQPRVVLERDELQTRRSPDSSALRRARNDLDQWPPPMMVEWARLRRGATGAWRDWDGDSGGRFWGGGCIAISATAVGHIAGKHGCDRTPKSAAWGGPALPRMLAASHIAATDRQAMQIGSLHHRWTLQRLTQRPAARSDQTANWLSPQRPKSPIKCLQKRAGGRP
jgi:hypothetical protein